MNNSVKNQVIWFIFGTQNVEEILDKWYAASPPQLKKSNHYTLWKADLMHLIKFRLLSSKIGRVLNSQLLHHLPSEFSDKQNCRNCYCVHRMCAPKVIKKLVDFWLKYSKKYKVDVFIGTQCMTGIKDREMSTHQDTQNQCRPTGATPVIVVFGCRH